MTTNVIKLGMIKSVHITGKLLRFHQSMQRLKNNGLDVWSGYEKKNQNIIRSAHNQRNLKQ